MVLMSRQQQTSAGVLVAELCCARVSPLKTKMTVTTENQRLESGIIAFSLHTVSTMSLECSQCERWLTLHERRQGRAAN